MSSSTVSGEGWSLTDPRISIMRASDLGIHSHSLLGMGFTGRHRLLLLLFISTREEHTKIVRLRYKRRFGRWMAPSEIYRSQVKFHLRCIKFKLGEMTY